MSKGKNGWAEQQHLFEPPPKRTRGARPRAPKRPVWTTHKARLIAEYLYRFVLVTKHGHYIDGFAGPQYPARPDAWAARLALEVEPAWLDHFYLCDADPGQVARLEALRAEYSDRAVRVVHGDFNEKVTELLDNESIGPRGATFCLLDQRTFECSWSTPQQIAAHRSEGYKIEQFYFLANAWLPRAIRSRTSRHAQGEVARWWGRDDWYRLPDLKGMERAMILAERFRHELGYRWCTPWPIYEAASTVRIMYFMVHATDHPRAVQLMSDAYNHATASREPIQTIALRLGLPPPGR